MSSSPPRCNKEEEEEEQDQDSKKCQDTIKIA